LIDLARKPEYEQKENGSAYHTTDDFRSRLHLRIPVDG